MTILFMKRINLVDSHVGFTEHSGTDASCVLEAHCYGEEDSLAEEDDEYQGKHSDDVGLPLICLRWRVIQWILHLEGPALWCFPLCFCFGSGSSKALGRRVLDLLLDQMPKSAVLPVHNLTR